MFDYLLDQLTAQDTPIPDATWIAATEAVQIDLAQAWTLGYRAFISDRPDLATELWQRAIDSRHPDLAPAAAFGLGMLRRKQGDLSAAAAAWQLVIDSGHADVAPRAMHGLGELRRKQGDLSGAAAAWQLVIDFGDPVLAPLAAGGLGVLRGRRERGARPASPSAKNRCTSVITQRRETAYSRATSLLLRPSTSTAVTISCGSPIVHPLPQV